MLLSVLIGLGFLYLGLCAAVFFGQRSLIYHPQAGRGNRGAPLLTLASGGERVLVSTRPLEGPSAVIYFGGNAEDVSGSLPAFGATFPGHAIYLMHYRGFGGSSGSPSEAGLFTDALALYDRMREEHPHVTLIGRSLGSGIAVRVASLRPVSRLVLVTPFDSLVDFAAGLFPYLPVRWLLRDRYESWQYAPRVTAPTLIVAAERDEIIPRASTDLLLTRFQAGVASMAVIEGASHNDLSAYEEYWALLAGERH